MSGLQVRMDVHEREGGPTDFAWGLRATGQELMDELWLLYSLKQRDNLPTPKLYASGVTHELAVYSLDGSKIEFDKSLWVQPQLKPQLPAQLAFQFRTDHEYDALKRVQGMMTRMLAGLAQMPTTREAWKVQFPMAVWIPVTPPTIAAQAARTGEFRAGEG